MNGVEAAIWHELMWHVRFAVMCGLVAAMAFALLSQRGKR